ncbi:hypothetical protein TMatcc_000771 [Talaromyces marneffei ATCC 18224]|uniref:Uncharacterized protein n=2 Tax=Talaromyces marneffei TaxID=37727 RepID=B6QRD4_TALMQ|nr:uncharacterized protein EYB26_003328 [Talaromyces marneffei]EEA20780.1 hypothetical protein PMAA_046020 [Talaromyces marneffei ATCC 18224]KAE8549741.1 hypothetical protein EYB25_008265 [Talaromyces marneffei]QGA15668.1 hypothetical protein EYB26_003328 [Talaromyces marneffei]
MFGNPSDPATNMAPGATSYRSPKRKRDVVEEAEDGTPPASPTSTHSVASYAELRLLEGEELGRYSPRTAVAGRFKELAIHEGVPHSLPIAQWHGSGSAAKNIESSGQAENLQLSPQKSPFKTTQLEISNGNDSNEDHVTKEHTQPTTQSTNGSSRNKVKAVSPTKSRRKKSPPPDESVILDSLTWDDSEITGHNPTDPNDDGYGINGIGFKPTAAIAWARSQQRQKQVTEWKNREAREAREKRRERREGVSRVKSEYDPGGAVQKKVKFDLR